MSSTAPVLLTINQRVYRNKGSHRLIGIVADVIDGNNVRVHWADDERTSSKHTAITSLTAVTILDGATVVRGRIKPAYAMTARTPKLGVVTSISPLNDERCTVTWDDQTVTTQSTLDVFDINWIQPISLGGLSSEEWLTAFASSHSIDLIVVTQNVYRCKRHEHVTPGCRCHDDNRQSNKHNILPSCMCGFRITILSDGRLQLSGSHVHHIQGKLHETSMKLP
jgi:hypothetical protein